MDFYTRFKAAHPIVEIGFISFHKLKPYFVRKLKDFNTCCKYHQELIEIKVGFNNLRAPRVHQQGLNSPCACCCESICGNPIKRAGQGQRVSCQTKLLTIPTDLVQIYRKSFNVPKSRETNGSM